MYTLRPCRRRGATSLSEWLRGGPLGARAWSGVSGHRGGIHGCTPALHSDWWVSVLDQLFSHLDVTSDVSDYWANRKEGGTGNQAALLIREIHGGGREESFDGWINRSIDGWMVK